MSDAHIDRVRSTREGEAADALGELLATGIPSGEPPSAEAHWAGRDAFVRTVVTSGGRRRAVAPWHLALAAAAVGLLVAGIALWWSNTDDPTRAVPVAEAPLEWAVEGTLETDVSGRFVATAPAALVFSDASRVELEPGAELVLEDARANGIDLRLETGVVHLDVTHAEQTDWSIFAGEVRVDVVGTRFEVARDATGRVAVTLHEGAVEVGSAAQAPVRLLEGHVLVVADGKFAVSRIADALPADVTATTPSASSASPDALPEGGPAEPPIDEMAPDVAVAVPTAVDEPAVDEPPAPRDAAPVGTEASARVRVGTGWPSRVADGDFAGVVAEAREIGVAKALRRTDRAALVALSEAARFGGESELAAKALDAVRERFPGTRDAAMAAFVLGRLAESDRALGVAADWYARYRDEAPQGALVDEALGREMAVRARLGETQRAAGLAARYLEQHPNGAYARAAASILEQ